MAGEGKKTHTRTKNAGTNVPFSEASSHSTVNFVGV